MGDTSDSTTSHRTEIDVNTEFNPPKSGINQVIDCGERFCIICEGESLAKFTVKIPDGRYTAGGYVGFCGRECLDSYMKTVSEIDGDNELRNLGAQQDAT